VGGDTVVVAEIGPAGAIRTRSIGDMITFTDGVAWSYVVIRVVIAGVVSEVIVIELLGGDHAEVRLEPVQRAHRLAFLSRLSARG
jgi:hypothetical protein